MAPLKPRETEAVTVEQREGKVMPRLAQVLLRTRKDVQDVMVTVHEDGSARIDARVVKSRRSLAQLISDLGFAVSKEVA